MKINKYIISAILLSLTSCTNSIISEANMYYSVEKKILIKKYDNIFINFPNIIEDGYIKGRISPSDNTSVDSLRGYFYLVYPLDKPGTDLKLTMSGKILDSIRYSDIDNTIISPYNLMRKRYEVERECNVEHVNKYPIPYFEDWNLGLDLGSKQIMTIGDDKYPVDVYTVPSDLMVYVLSANPLLINSSIQRPRLLKKWKNGYSCGIAISKKENIIIYWFMQW